MSPSNLSLYFDYLPPSIYFSLIKRHISVLFLHKNISLFFRHAFQYFPSQSQFFLFLFSVSLCNISFLLALYIYIFISRSCSLFFPYNIFSLFCIPLYICLYFSLSLPYKILKISLSIYSFQTIPLFFHSASYFLYFFLYSLFSFLLIISVSTSFLSISCMNFYNVCAV